jgi:hypothetical protein
VGYLMGARLATWSKASIGNLFAAEGRSENDSIGCFAFCNQVHNSEGAPEFPHSFYHVMYKKMFHEYFFIFFV